MFEGFADGRPIFCGTDNRYERNSRMVGWYIEANVDEGDHKHKTVVTK